jgi:hypothetical protein
VDGGHVEDAEDLGTVQDALEAVRRELVGEVDDRARRGGQWQAVDVRDVLGRERLAAVHADRLRRVALAQSDHVDLAARHCHQFQRRRGAAVPEQRRIGPAARQHRRQ